MAEKIYKIIGQDVEKTRDRVINFANTLYRSAFGRGDSLPGFNVFSLTQASRGPIIFDLYDGHLIFGKRCKVLKIYGDDEGVEALKNKIENKLEVKLI